MNLKAAIAAMCLVLAACAPAGAHESDPTAPPTTRPVVTAPRWRFEPDDAPGAMTGDDRGVVALAGDRAAFALDQTGKVAWRHEIADLGIEYPALGAGLAIASTDDTAGAHAHGAFVALDRRTGALRWSIAVDSEPGPVTVASGHVFLATQSGELIAAAMSGEVAWRVHLVGGVSSRGNLAYDPATATLLAVVFVPHQGWMLTQTDARTGDDVGGFDLGAADPPSAVVSAGPGRVVVGDGDTDELLVIDLRKRRVVRTVRTPAGFDPASIPAVEGNLAVVIDRTGNVTAADLTTGDVRWQRSLDVPVLDARPLLTRSALVTATFAEPMNVLARDDGRPLDRGVGGPDRPGGIPVAFALDGRSLVVARRFAPGDSIDAWPVP